MIRFAQHVSLSLRQTLVLGALALTLLALASGASAFSFTTIDVPGASQTDAFGVNKAGQIVGFYEDASFTLHGFLRNTDGTFTTIDVPGAGSTTAGGISGRKIVGGYSDGNGWHGFLLKRGHFLTIDVPGAQQSTAALGISGKKIVGYYLDLLGIPHGFLATP
jgi:probable HAF family extracellular repeat protein